MRRKLQNGDTTSIGVWCIAVFGFFTLPTQAALVSRLNGEAVYDTDLDITWVANANLAASNQFGVTSGIILTGAAAGQMTWDTAQSWIAGMNAANYLGLNDWRLPTTQTPDASCSTSQVNAIGNNCTRSEMGHLFYIELGGTAGNNILYSGDPDLAKFQNIVSSYYWSTDYTPTVPLGDAYHFNFGAGDQIGSGKTATDNVWAVRSGDVAVPLPAAIWLFGSGFLNLIGIARRKKHAYLFQRRLFGAALFCDPSPNRFHCLAETWRKMS